MDNCEVVVIGAGPYGLSVAAHLRSMGVAFRIFGSPMEFWLKHMPKGMHLKSEGFASSLFATENMLRNLSPGARKNPASPLGIEKQSPSV